MAQPPNVEHLTQLVCFFPVLRMLVVIADLADVVAPSRLSVAYALISLRFQARTMPRFFRGLALSFMGSCRVAV